MSSAEKARVCYPLAADNSGISMNEWMYGVPVKRLSSEGHLHFCKPCVYLSLASVAGRHGCDADEQYPYKTILLDNVPLLTDFAPQK
jgi:hypothetical protein